MIFDYEALKAKITKNVLKIIGEKSVRVLIAEINTYVDDVEYGLEPFLDVFGSHIFDGKNIKQALKTAIDNDEYGYLDDVFDVINWIEGEINLKSVYKKWPDNTDESDTVVASLLKEIVEENATSFQRIEKFYFHHFDEFDFITIIGEPI